MRTIVFLLAVDFLAFSGLAAVASWQVREWIPTVLFWATAVSSLGIAGFLLAIFTLSVRRDP